MIRVIVLVAVIAAFLLLSVANWTLVPFLLPQGRQVMIPLPLLIAAAFMAGWLPTWISQQAITLRLRRKLERAERQLAEFNRPPPPPPPPSMG